MDTKLLFVCLGNICRSPAAEGIMKHIVKGSGMEEKFEIDSAGTYGGHAGNLPDSRMRGAAAKRGYNLNSRSRKIRYDDFDKFDRVIVMDDMNYQRVCEFAPSKEAINKVYRMVNFSKNMDVSHVPDPYYEGVDGFEYVLDILEDACMGLYEDINK